LMKSKRLKKGSKNSMKEHKTQSFIKSPEPVVVSQSISSSKSRMLWTNFVRNARSW
jgi:hypothetical protein